MLLLCVFYPGRGPRSLLDAVPFLYFHSHISNAVACFSGSLGCMVGLVGLYLRSPFANIRSLTLRVTARCNSLQLLHIRKEVIWVGTLYCIPGVTLSLLILGAGFQLMALKSPKITSDFGGPRPTSVCNTATSCNDCIRTGGCGFCFENSISSIVNGSCFPVNTYSNHTDFPALYGPCSAESETTAWADNWCPTDYSWLIILGLVSYLFCFAPGTSEQQYTCTRSAYAYF